MSTKETATTSAPIWPVHLVAPRGIDLLYTYMHLCTLNVHIPQNVSIYLVNVNLMRGLLCNQYLLYMNMLQGICLLLRLAAKVTSQSVSFDKFVSCWTKVVRKLFSKGAASYLSARSFHLNPNQPGHVTVTRPWALHQHYAEQHATRLLDGREVQPGNRSMRIGQGGKALLGGKAARQAESVAAKGSGIHWSLGHTSCPEPCGVNGKSWKIHIEFSFEAKVLPITCDCPFILSLLFESHSQIKRVRMVWYDKSNRWIFKWSTSLVKSCSLLLVPTLVWCEPPISKWSYRTMYSLVMSPPKCQDGDYISFEIIQVCSCSNFGKFGESTSVQAWCVLCMASRKWTEPSFATGPSNPKNPDHIFCIVQNMIKHDKTW